MCDKSIHYLEAVELGGIVECCVPVRISGVNDTLLFIIREIIEIVSHNVFPPISGSLPENNKQIKTVIEFQNVKVIKLQVSY